MSRSRLFPTVSLGKKDKKKEKRKEKGGKRKKRSAGWSMTTAAKVCCRLSLLRRLPRHHGDGVTRQRRKEKGMKEKKRRSREKQGEISPSSSAKGVPYSHFLLRS